MENEEIPRGPYRNQSDPEASSVRIERCLGALWTIERFLRFVIEIQRDSEGFLQRLEKLLSVLIETRGSQGSF